MLDAQGRLDEASFPDSDPLDFTPLPDDSLETIERASGVITDYVYHAQGPLDTITVTAPGTGQLLALDYALNAVQNITGLDEQYRSSDPDEPYVFGYDGANRLTSANYPAAYDLPPTDASYEYDPAGNRETPGTPGDYDYDANNRLTISPFAALSCYDADGNLTSKRSSGDCSTGTVVESFTWDHANRLRTFTKSGTSAAYAYDPLGRRIKKTVGSTTTWYVWDGDRLLVEYDGTGDRDVRYAYAGGFAPLQVAYENGPSEGVYDVHSDHLDTPRMLTDEFGVPSWRASYEAFGKAHVSSDPDGSVPTPNPNLTFNVRFPGQYYDAETERWDPTLNGGAGGVVEGSGLHYNRFRTYDPNTGTYAAADPIGQAGEINVYPYALNNPMKFFDPLGLDVFINFGKPATYHHAWVTVGGSDPRGDDGSESFGAYPAGGGGVADGLWGGDTAVYSPDPSSEQGQDSISFWTRGYSTTPEIEDKLIEWIEENYGIGEDADEIAKNPSYWLGLQDCTDFASAVEDKLQDLLEEAGLPTTPTRRYVLPRSQAKP